MFGFVAEFARIRAALDCPANPNSGEFGYGSGFRSDLALSK